MNKNMRVLLTIIACGWGFLSGCTLPDGKPQIPRPLGTQRAEATHWDPYAAVDVAPEIVGIRPRDYQRPAAEAKRAGRFRDAQFPF